MQTRRRVLTTAAAGAAALSVGSTLGAAGSGDADDGGDTPRSAGDTDPGRDIETDEVTEFGVADDAGVAFANAQAVRTTDHLTAGARTGFADRLDDAVGDVGVDPADVTAVAFGPDHVALTGDFPATAVQLRMLFDGYDADGTHAGYDVYGGDTDAVAFADGELFRTHGALGDVDGVRAVVDAALDTSPADNTGGQFSARSPHEDAVGDLLAALGDGDVVTVRRGGSDRVGVEAVGRVGGYDAVGLSRRFDGEFVTERRALAFERPGAVPVDAVGALASRESWFDGAKTERFETAGCAVVEATYAAETVDQVLP